MTFADFGCPVFDPLVYCFQTHLYYLAFQYFDIPDEEYSRNASCPVNLISTFLLYWSSNYDEINPSTFLLPLCYCFTVK